MLVSNRYLTEIYEHALEKKLNAKEVGLFLRREIMRVMNYNKGTFEDLEKKDINDEISKLIEMLSSEKISYTTAQKVLEKLYDEKFDVGEYVEKEGLVQVQDTKVIEEIVEKALKEAPKAVEDYKAGNEKSLHFIVGIVMRETKGTAKPNVVQEILRKKVGEM